MKTPSRNTVSHPDSHSETEPAMQTQTSDNPDEVFDIVDIDDKVIGQRTRRECNSNPRLIHRSVFILVYNDNNQVLWQKRSLTKDKSPGLWVTSVSGHVDAGEDYLQTAQRETMEELGVDLPLSFLGKFLFRYPDETEFSAVFQARSNGPFQVNRQEVDEIAFMTVSEFLKKEQAGDLELSPAVNNVINALALH